MIFQESKIMGRTSSFKIKSETKSLNDSKKASEKSNVRHVNAESKKFYRKDQNKAERGLCLEKISYLKGL